MTDLDKRWEEFHKDLDTDGVSKASASGALEAMDAKLNQMAVKLDELNDKISEAAAPPEMPPGMDMMGGAPPMPPEAAGGMPPGGAPLAGPEGAPADMPPAEGGADMPPGGAPPAGPEGAPPMPPGAAAPAGPPMGGAPMPSLQQLLSQSQQMPQDMLPQDIMGGLGMGSGEEKDPTLDALQGALSEAEDPEVIRNLAEILLDYSDKLEQKEQEEAITQPMAAPGAAPAAGGVPPELAAALGGAEGAPADVPPELAAAMGGEEQSAEAPTDVPPELAAALGGTEGGMPDVSAGEGGEIPPEMIEAILSGKMASDGKTKVNELNPIKKAEEEKKMPAEEPKADDKKDMAVVIDVSPDEATKTESNGEQAVSDTANCPIRALKENPEVLNMTLGELITTATKSSPAPEKDPNMFVHGGEPTDSVTACAGSDLMPTKKSVLRSFEEDMDYFASNPYAGREDYYEPIVRSMSEEDELREMIASIVKSYTSADAIADVTIGEALDTISLIKSTGVPDTERRFVDTLDIIARYTDGLAGEAATEELMKSKGIDMSLIFDKTEPITKMGKIYNYEKKEDITPLSQFITPVTDPSTKKVIGNSLNTGWATYTKPASKGPGGASSSILDMSNFGAFNASMADAAKTLDTGKPAKERKVGTGAEWIQAVKDADPNLVNTLTSMGVGGVTGENIAAQILARQSGVLDGGVPMGFQENNIIQPRFNNTEFDSKGKIIDRDIRLDLHPDISTWRISGGDAPNVAVLKLLSNPIFRLRAMNNFAQVDDDVAEWLNKNVMGSIDDNTLKFIFDKMLPGNPSGIPDADRLPMSLNSLKAMLRMGHSVKYKQNADGTYSMSGRLGKIPFNPAATDQKDDLKGTIGFWYNTGTKEDPNMMFNFNNGSAPLTRLQNTAPDKRLMTYIDPNDIDKISSTPSVLNSFGLVDTIISNALSGARDSTDANAILGMPIYNLITAKGGSDPNKVLKYVIGSMTGINSTGVPAIGNAGTLMNMTVRDYLTHNFGRNMGIVEDTGSQKMKNLAIAEAFRALGEKMYADPKLKGMIGGNYRMSADDLEDLILGRNATTSAAGNYGMASYRPYVAANGSSKEQTEGLYSYPRVYNINNLRGENNNVTAQDILDFYDAITGLSSSDTKSVIPFIKAFNRMFNVNPMGNMTDEIQKLKDAFTREIPIKTA